MFLRSLMLLLALAVAGCAEMSLRGDRTKPVQAVDGIGEAATGPAPLTEASAPAANAVTVEQFDTTSAAERAAVAEKPAAVSEVRLGSTVASLGDPADPGFWAETGLVDQVVMGRLEYPAKGTSVQVELRPSGGAPGSGTRVSLPAMRVLEAPLTDLPTLIVFSG